VVPQILGQNRYTFTLIHMSILTNSLSYASNIACRQETVGTINRINYRQEVDYFPSYQDALPTVPVDYFPSRLLVPRVSRRSKQIRSASKASDAEKTKLRHAHRLLGSPHAHRLVLVFSVASFTTALPSC